MRRAGAHLAGDPALLFRNRPPSSGWLPVLGALLEIATSTLYSLCPDTTPRLRERLGGNPSSQPGKPSAVQPWANQDLLQGGERAALVRKVFVEHGTLALQLAGGGVAARLSGGGAGPAMRLSWLPARLNVETPCVPARGIGEGCVRVFFEAGSNVVIADRDEKGGG